jgi:hypothetical protein
MLERDTLVSQSACHHVLDCPIHLVTIAMARPTEKPVRKSRKVYFKEFEDAAAAAR